MGEKQLRARIQMLRRIDSDLIASTWLDATSDGTTNVDSVVLVADPEEDLMKQLLARPGMERLPRHEDLVLAAVPGQLAAFLLQGNENEKIRESVATPPPAEAGNRAFWCVVVGVGGVTLVPVQISATDA